MIVEESVWTFKISNRDPMRDNRSELLTGRPEMQMKCRGFDRERRRQAPVQVECDGMIGRRAYRGRDACETRQHGAMHVSGRDQLCAWMLPHYTGKVVGVAEILHIH